MHASKPRKPRRFAYVVARRAGVAALKLALMGCGPSQPRNPIKTPTIDACLVPKPKEAYRWLQKGLDARRE